MATYPIKVLLDRNRQPFIPFSTTSSIVENGTNRRLDKILGNLDDLQTNNKNSLVSAINEILTQHGSGGSSTGWQVVDKLPTENISATTIYLVHKEGSKKPNIYEEWIWVNEDWENIGTTEIDLSGYATTNMVGDLNNLLTTDKDNLVDAINEIVVTAGGTSANIGNLNNLITEDKSSVVNAINEVASNSKGISEVGIYTWQYNNFPNQNNYNLKTAYNDFFKNMINDAYAKGKKGIILIKTSDSTSGFNDEYQYAFTSCSCDLQLKPTAIKLYGSPLVSSVNIYSKINFEWASIRISGTWNEDVFEPTSIYWDGIKNIAFLSTDNRWSYTPVNPYNPATKKYVDDAIAAGTGGGSSFDPAKYLAIDNTTEYTPTDLYHPATKGYVDSLIASVPEPIDAYSKTEIDGKLANYLSKTNTESYTPTSDYHPATKKFVESVVSSIDMSGYYNKTDIATLFAGYNTRLIYDDYQGNTVFTDPDNLTKTWDFLINRTKIYNIYGNAKKDSTTNKLCIFEPNPLTTKNAYYIEVNFGYTSNTGVLFDGRSNYPEFYYVDDTGVEQRLDSVELSDSAIIESHSTNSSNDKIYTYHYVVEVYGNAVGKDIYIKRYYDITAKAATSGDYRATFAYPYISAKVLE